MRKRDKTSPENGGLVLHGHVSITTRKTPKTPPTTHVQAGKALAFSIQPTQLSRSRPPEIITSSVAGALVEKKGFHPPPLVPKQFGPRLMLVLVPVQTKMWARKL
jgi:hypothetical protein